MGFEEDNCILHFKETTLLESKSALGITSSDLDLTQFSAINFLELKKLPLTKEQIIANKNLITALGGKLYETVIKEYPLLNSPIFNNIKQYSRTFRDTNDKPDLEISIMGGIGIRSAKIPNKTIRYTDLIITTPTSGLELWRHPTLKVEFAILHIGDFITITVVNENIEANTWVL